MIRFPLALLATIALPSLAQAETFTISWWGFNGDKLDEIIVQPFQEKCGCEIVFETGNNADRLNKLRVRGAKGVDVIYLSDSFSQQGIDQGLFLPLDRAKLPHVAELHEIAQAPQGDYGPAYTLGRIGIVYDSAKVTPPITAWADLWRADLASSVSLPGITTTAGPMVVLVAGEKAGADPFAAPAPAFEQIAEMKPNVVKNYNTGSEMVNLFSTGEITVSLAQDFALGQLQAAVPTIAWAQLADGDIATTNTINIPKGSENVDRAYEFIDFVLSAEIQKKLAESGTDAPSNATVELAPEVAAKWTYGRDQIATLKRVDYAAMNAAKAGWIDRWNEIFGM